MKKGLDRYLLGSLLILLLIACFLALSIKFLYSVTKETLEPDQEKVKSQVIQFNMEDYQKLDERFKTD